MRSYGTALLLAVALLVRLATGGVLHVDFRSIAAAPDGHSWDCSFPTLSAALAVAGADAEIWVRAGVYKPEGNSPTATFKLPPGTTLFGGFRGDETRREARNPRANRTILSGDMGLTGKTDDNCLHILTLSGNGSIDGFIITSGNNRDGGAALKLGTKTESFSATDCTFEKNRAEQGGAICAANGRITLSNCTFFNNAANHGGALYLAGNATLNASNCHFTSNHAQEYGGAVTITGSSSATFDHCHFLFNHSEKEGGAIAGILKTNAPLTLHLANCDLSENSAAGMGGGIYADGLFSPRINTCHLTLNRSGLGSTITGRNGAGPVIEGGTFVSNKNAEGYTDLDFTAPSNAIVVADVKPEKEHNPEPIHPKKIERQLPDVMIHHPRQNLTALRGVVAESDYTVLAFGDLTDPEFLTAYRHLEAAAYDYANKGVTFYYLLSYLRHPENHGYVQATTFDDRSTMLAETRKILQTRISWLCDDLEHNAAKTLLHSDHRVFIFNKEGVEKYAGTISDTDALRAALARMAGKVQQPTKPNSMAESALPPVEVLETKYVDRVKTTLSDRFTAIQCTSLKPELLQPVKVRIEADKKLLDTGSGRLYVGLHIDPLYSFRWNNFASPASYNIRTASKTIIAPSRNYALKITRVPADTEPREFMMEVQNWNDKSPLALTISYPIVAPQTGQQRELTHHYLLYLQPDPFGGTVFGRQEPIPASSAKRPLPR